MTRDHLRPAVLARRVLLPPVLAGGAAICVLVVLAAATHPSARGVGPLASRENAARALAVELSQDLEGTPTVVDIRRARLPLGL